MQAEISSTIEILAVLPDWSKSAAYEDLEGKCEGLGEVKVDVADLCIRLLGFKGPGKREFTLLLGFAKRTNSDYATHCPRALKRKEGVLKDGRRAPICSFP